MTHGTWHGKCNVIDALQLNRQRIGGTIQEKAAMEASQAGPELVCSMAKQ